MSNADQQTLAVFERYYNQYYPIVYGQILNRIRNPADAEDLTMDIFLKCWEKFDSFDPEKAAFGTWLFVIVSNKLKNFYRDRKETDDIDEVGQYIEADGSFEEDLLQIDFLRSARAHLAHALEALPETQQQIVIRKYYRKKNANEIAAEIGMSPGNVRVQLHRALARMRKYFEDNNIEWE